MPPSAPSVPATPAILDLLVTLRVMADIAQDAGQEVARLYAGPLSVRRKADDSPVTEADERSHERIAARLTAAFPDIPLLSEEGGIPAYDQRAGWDPFWLVDPLDGTKGFVNRDGEYTVNIALVQAGRPVLGVIAVPAEARVFLGGPGVGAFRRTGEGSLEPIAVARGTREGGPVVLQSRVRQTPRLDAFLRDYPAHRRRSAGSAYKFCLLAEGAADLFPCLHTTWEWDTAAGEALLHGAGGAIVDIAGHPLGYNKPDLRNGHFVASGGEPWGPLTPPAPGVTNAPHDLHL